MTIGKVVPGETRVGWVGTGVMGASMCGHLIDKGFAYVEGTDVFYSVEKFSGYGELSGRRLEDMKAGSRIAVDERKRHPMDFVLWKGAKPGEPQWPSPWGPGRPGWHMECSVMSGHFLGSSFDIHGGGEDLLFPHHENERAQSIAANGGQFARYWIHNGFVTVESEKMSKSLGNLVTIEEFLSKHSADVFRILVLNSYYRNPLTFNDDVIAQSEKALERLVSALRPALPGARGLEQSNLAAAIDTARTGFTSSMDEDINTAGALASLFELVRSINQARADGATNPELQPAQETLRELSGVLGLRLDTDSNEETGQQAAPFIELLISLRTELRKQKNFGLADQIRVQLAEQGVTMEDSKDGTSWRWSK